MRFILVSILLALVCSSLCQDIDNLNELITRLRNNPSARIGVLSMSNFISVKQLLPANTLPLVVEHEEDLVKMVQNGSVIAALSTGLPEKIFQDPFHIIPSGIISIHTILMAPDYSTDFVNGVKNASLSTKHLALAMNAAIAKIQSDGQLKTLADKNKINAIAQSFTCKSDNKTHFNLPNRKDAKGLLAEVLNSALLKVLCQGKPNWGDNDGNYQKDPPVGFYPDYLNKIVEVLSTLSGPDKEPYGPITIKRVTDTAAPFPWYKLFDGSAHMTEPYFLLDGTYSGSGKKCATQDDCLPSDEENKNETCDNSTFCKHDIRPRILMLRSTCTTVGTESMFYTLRTSTSNQPDPGSKTGGVALTYMVIISLLCVIALLFLAFVIFREKYGVPLFRPRY